MTSPLCTSSSLLLSTSDLILSQTFILRMGRWAGSLPSAYPGVFLWLSVNKIQTFSAVQRQPPAVHLCNDHTHPLCLDILWEAKVKAKPSLLSGSSQTNTLPTRPSLGLFPPPADPLRERSPVLTFHILLDTVHSVSGSMKEDLPPTHRESLGKSHSTCLIPSSHPSNPTLTSLPASFTFVPPA